MDERMNLPVLAEACRVTHADLQAYVDGALARERSLEIFLHVRDCAECALALAEMKALFVSLASLPALAVPADFDARVLAAVPYQAYREMEPLRRDRVPVFLEEEFLPAVVRAPGVRLAGAALAVVAVAGLIVGRLPEASLIAAPLGLLPEVLVRVQRLVRRRFVGHAQGSESG